MKRTVTEKFDKHGKLIERTISTEEEIVPPYPWRAYPFVIERTISTVPGLPLGTSVTYTGNVC